MKINLALKNIYTYVGPITNEKTHSWVLLVQSSVLNLYCTTTQIIVILQYIALGKKLFFKIF